RRRRLVAAVACYNDFRTGAVIDHPDQKMRLDRIAFTKPEVIEHRGIPMGLGRRLRYRSVEIEDEAALVLVARTEHADLGALDRRADLGPGIRRVVGDDQLI